MKRTSIQHCSSQRKEELAEYHTKAEQYIKDHPYCEIFMAEHGLLLKDINDRGWADLRSPEERKENICKARMVHVPRSIEVHHRNGRNGRERLLDERFWMAAHRSSHNHIKDHQSWARRRGYLLPVNARPDGTYPGTEKILTTPELLDVQHELFFDPLDPGESVRILPRPFCFWF